MPLYLSWIWNKTVDLFMEMHISGAKKNIYHLYYLARTQN